MAIEAHVMGTEVKLMGLCSKRISVERVRIRKTSQTDGFALDCGTSCEVKFRNRNLRKARTVFMG
jgi:hypothetical protein